MTRIEFAKQFATSILFIGSYNCPDGHDPRRKYMTTDLTPLSVSNPNQFLDEILAIDQLAAVRVASSWGTPDATPEQYNAAWNITRQQSVASLCEKCGWPVLEDEPHSQCVDQIIASRLKKLFDEDESTAWDAFNHHTSWEDGHQQRRVIGILAEQSVLYECIYCDSISTSPFNNGSCGCDEVEDDYDDQCYPLGDD